MAALQHINYYIQSFKYCILLVLLLSSFFHADAQVKRRMEGTIINQNNQPFPNVIVSLKTNPKGQPFAFAFSNASGKYVISHQNIDSFFYAEFKFLGYKTVLNKITNAVLVTHDLKISSDTVELNAIILNTRQPITVNGDTTSFRVDYFKQGNESSVGDLVSNMPGFSVENGKIRYNDRIVDRVLIEGDDLFGRDYSTVTKNVNPNGLEKVDLVKNYSDKSYLKNTMDKGQEQVVNLRFKKSYQSKIFGTEELGASGNLEYGSLQGNLISLIPKVKFVTTNNFNNTGALASELLNKNNLMAQLGFKSEESIDFDLRLRMNANQLLSLPEKQTSILEKKDYHFNQTGLITNNMYFKPSKKIFVKNNIQLYLDQDQVRNTRDEFYEITGGAAFKYAETLDMNNTSKYLNVLNEIAYTANPKHQLILKTQINTQVNDGNSLGFVQANKNVQGLVNDHQIFRNQLSWINVLSRRRSIEMNIQYSRSKFQENLSFSPAKTIYHYTKDSLYEQLSSQANHLHKELNLEFKYTKKTEKGSYYLSSNFSTGNIVFNSQVNLFNVKDQTTPSINDSLKNVNNYQGQSVNLIFFFRRELSEKLDISFLNKLELNQLKDKQQLNIDATYLQYLPTLNLSYKINNQSLLSTNIQTNNKLPVLNELLSNYVISDYRTIIRGTNQSFINSDKSISLNYSYAAIASKKMFFNAAIILANSQNGYIDNSLVDYYYITRVKEIYDNQFKSLFGYLNYQQYARIIKSNIKINFSYANNRSNFLNNSVLFALRLNSYNYGINFKTAVHKNLVIGYAFRFTDSYQSSTSKTLSTSNHQTLSKYSIDWNLKALKRWSFFGNIDYIHSRQANNQSKIALGTMSMRYNLKNQKSYFTATVNNIFNNDALEYYSLSPISTISEKIMMLPRYLIIKYAVPF